MIIIKEAKPEHVQAIVEYRKALMEIHKEIDAEFLKILICRLKNMKPPSQKLLK